MDSRSLDNTKIDSSPDSDITHGSGNVFADLGFEKEEAANLKMRARLMVRLRRLIKERGMTQQEAADFFGVSQPRISDLVNKKIEKFSIDKLVNMLTQAGVQVGLNFSEDTSASGSEDSKVAA